MKNTKAFQGDQGIGKTHFFFFFLHIFLNLWNQCWVGSVLTLYSYARGVCNFLGSVSLQQKKWSVGPVLQPSDEPVLKLYVTAQFYLESKGKYILEAWGHADPKDAKRRAAPLFTRFLSPPWACPVYYGLARSAACFTWAPHSSPLTFLCSIFTGFSLPCLLATAILHSFFLF